MMKAAISIGALLSSLFFPPLVVVLIVWCAALYVPPVALAAGLITDALYYVPEASAFPVATAVGFLGMLAAFFVRRLIEARVMLP